VRSTGVNNFRGVQAGVGEVIAWRNLFWAISDAMAKSPQPGPNGTLLPNLQYGLAYRVFMTYGWPKVLEIIQHLIAGSLIVYPSSPEDFKNPELRPFIDKI